MSVITKSVLAATFAFGLSTAAQSATIDNAANWQGDIDTGMQIAFDFANTVNVQDDSGVKNDLQTSPFTISGDFTLSIIGNTGGTDIGFFVEDAAGNKLSTTIAPDAVSTCSGFGAVQDCDLIFAGSVLPQTLFSDSSTGATEFAAGGYNIGIFGATAPDTGTITFELTKVAAVPLPAGGLLLLTALGGGMAMRRRRKA